MEMKHRITVFTKDCVYFCGDFNKLIPGIIKDKNNFSDIQLTAEYKLLIFTLQRRKTLLFSTNKINFMFPCLPNLPSPWGDWGAH